MHRATVGGCAVAVLTLGALLTGCASEDPAATPATASPADAAPPAAPAGPPPTPGAVVFSDEMDDDRNGWGEGDGTSFAGGDYVFSGIAPIGVATWPDAMVGATPDAVLVTARLSAAAQDAVLAVTCNMNQDDQGEGAFYALGIGPDGALISRTSSAAPTPLAEGVLASTGAALDLTVPHDVQGACVPVGEEMHLWLSVDGAAVLSAVDPDPLGAGPPGIDLVAGPDAAEGSAFEARAASFSVATPA
jgi:hypothetical protein